MKKRVYLGLALAFSLCAPARILAQSGITMPTMPSMPSMPSVGSGFYSPSTSGFYNGNRTTTNKNSTAKTESESTSEKKIETSKTELSEEAKKILADELNSALASSKTDEKNSATSMLSNILTAKDIANLNDLGLIGDIGEALKKHPEIAEAEESEKTSELENLIGDLEQIKEATPKDQKKVSLSSEPAKADPKILRFTADNADCLKIIKETFFSTESLEGTFLLTGDCKYSSGGIARNETFYILFKPNGADGGITNYSVTATVSQDTENPDSFLKKLEAATQNGNIIAHRTGNLVTLRINDQSLKLDMLLAM